MNVACDVIPFLKLTARTWNDSIQPKKKESFNHQFSGGELLVFNKGTLPKTNMDTQNDGLEITPPKMLGRNALWLNPKFKTTDGFGMLVTPSKKWQFWVSKISGV